MALESLSKIEETEKKADENLAEARAEAKKIIAAAHDKAAAMHSKLREEIKDETQKFVLAYQSESAQVLQREREKTQLECIEIKKAAAKNMDRAVEDIIERVVNA